MEVFYGDENTRNPYQTTDQSELVLELARKCALDHSALKNVGWSHDCVFGEIPEGR